MRPPRKPGRRPVSASELGYPSRPWRMIGLRFVRALTPSRVCRMIGFFLGFDFPFLDEIGFFTIVPP